MLYIEVLQPRYTCIPVWALPIPLAATLGIIVIFFSSRYWDVSLPWVLPYTAMYSLYNPYLLIRGFPHSDIYDCLRVLTAHRSISLFAASFFASMCLGIHHTPFSTYIFFTFFQTSRFFFVKSYFLFILHYPVFNLLLTLELSHQKLNTKQNTLFQYCTLYCFSP